VRVDEIGGLSLPYPAGRSVNLGRAPSQFKHDRVRRVGAGDGGPVRALLPREGAAELQHFGEREQRAECPRTHIGRSLL